MRLTNLDNIIQVVCAQITSDCRHDEYQCANRACISVSSLCNKINDCGDWSDERLCNIDECDAHTDTCDQLCIDMPIGYTCACLPGHQLVSTTECVRTDVCATHTPCMQYCTNARHDCNKHRPHVYAGLDVVRTQRCATLLTTYSCSCDNGYVLINGSECKPVAMAALSSVLLIGGVHERTYFELSV
jgi:hypothetical protein